MTEPNRFNEIADYLGKHGIIRKVYAVTGECRIHAEGFALNKKIYEMFMVGLRNNMEGVKIHTTQTVLYTIKDADGGIKYA